MVFENNFSIVKEDEKYSSCLQEFFRSEMSDSNNFLKTLSKKFLVLSIGNNGVFILSMMKPGTLIVDGSLIHFLAIFVF